jgi:hypothetical protein
MPSPTREIKKTAETAASPPILRVAVCGEVSSGKSTVLNTLMRDLVLPDNLGQTTRPVITAQYRASRGIQVTRPDGDQIASGDFDDKELFHAAANVSLWCDQPHLAGFEFIEVPLTKAEELTDAQIALIKSADVMIWVTIASQAWRLTEKTIVELLGEARPPHAILVASRADKFRTEDDRGRVRDRIVRETTHLFDACVFVHGARKQIAEAKNSDDAWAATGGAEIMALLRAHAEDLRSRPALPEAEPDAPAPEPSKVIDIAAFRDQSRVSAPALSVEDTGDVAVEATTDIPVENVAVAEDAKPSAEHRAAPRPAPDAGAAPLLDVLRGILDGISGAVACGIMPPGERHICSVVLGSETQCNRVGNACGRAQYSLGLIYQAHDLPGSVSASTLSMSGHRLLFQDLPGIGLLFLMSDATLMNHGVAQRIFTQLCTACEASL